MSKREIDYFVDGCEMSSAEVDEDQEPRWIAEECALHYCDYCDGCEDRWPVEIAFKDKEGLLRRFRVELEFDPVFSAEEISEEGEAA